MGNFPSIIEVRGESLPHQWGGTFRGESGTVAKLDIQGGHFVVNLELPTGLAMDCRIVHVHGFGSAQSLHLAIEMAEREAARNVLKLPALIEWAKGVAQ